MASAPSLRRLKWNRTQHIVSGITAVPFVFSLFLRRRDGACGVEGDANQTARQWMGPVNTAITTAPVTVMLGASG